MQTWKPVQNEGRDGSPPHDGTRLRVTEHLLLTFTLRSRWGAEDEQRGRDPLGYHDACCGLWCALIMLGGRSCSEQVAEGTRSSSGVAQVSPPGREVWAWLMLRCASTRTRSRAHTHTHTHTTHRFLDWFYRLSNSSLCSMVSLLLSHKSKRPTKTFIIILGLYIFHTFIYIFTFYTRKCWVVWCQ